MRDRRLVCALLPLLVAGCVSDDNAAPGPADSGYVLPETSAPDAEGIDAAAPDATLPDTGVPDATGDTAPSSTSVTLTVIDANGKPEQGVPVFFSDPAGALLSSTTSDASGKVTQAVPAGSQVTAAFGPLGFTAFLTIVAVEPGDVLTAIDPRSVFSVQGEKIEITDLPPSPPDGGVEAGLRFGVSDGQCGGGGQAPPIEMNLTPGCFAGGQFPLLALAYDNAGDVLGYSFQKNNAVIPDGGLPDGSVVPVSMAAGTWAPLTTTTIAAAPLSGTYTLRDMVLGEVTNGVITPAGLLAGANDGGTQSSVFATHPGFADFLQTEANVNEKPQSTINNTSASLIGAIATRGAPGSGGATIDLSTLLPYLTDAVLDGTTPAQPTVSWTSTASLASTDGAVVLVKWNGSTQGQWTFVVPPATTVVQAPVLPASLAARAATTSGDFDQIPIIMFLDATFWSGYPDLRAGSTTLAAEPAVGNFQCIGSGSGCIPALPQDGTLRMSAYTGGGD